MVIALMFVDSLQKAAVAAHQARLLLPPAARSLGAVLLLVHVCKVGSLLLSVKFCWKFILSVQIQSLNHVRSHHHLALSSVHHVLSHILQRQ